ncbi:hypothetical protein DL98DRAFT_530847 [Cadophora sp. DSE1049]|nr:hypothetical protein DL98DRAFT_530847 [Cadophora sp. DSE1049]
MTSPILSFKLAFFLGALILLTTGALAAPSDNFHLSTHAGIPKGYRSERLHITGTIDGIKVNHTGTIEEVYSQIAAENPGFAPHEIGIIPRSLERREKSAMYCIPVPGQNWEKASDLPINNGIRSLQTNRLFCNVPAHTCVRVSCSSNAEIRVCNDSNLEIKPYCAWIASYAFDISKKCYSTWGIARPQGLVGGQYFDTDGFNVIVKKDTC